MRRLGLVVASAVLLGACTPASRTVISPRVACPAVLVAASRPEPAAVVMTPEQRLALDVGTVRAVGAPLASAEAEQRLQHEAWGRDGWSRVAVGRSWCAQLDRTAGDVSDTPG